VYEFDHRPRGERDLYKLLYAGFMAAPIIAGTLVLARMATDAPSERRFADLPA
jgi:hypothetical protein